MLPITKKEKSESKTSEIWRLSLNANWRMNSQTISYNFNIYGNVDVQAPSETFVTENCTRTRDYRSLICVKHTSYTRS